MKRLLFVFCVVGLLAALPMSHLAFAGKPEEKPAKVAICHIIAANDVIPFGPVLLYFGKEISVAPAAVPAHEAHGDSTKFFGGEEAAGPIAAFREAGANLPAADCYIVVRPE